LKYDGLREKNSFFLEAFPLILKDLGFDVLEILVFLFY
jgi:hypothetical protein